MEKYAPSINVNGETVTPRGYEWFIAFALRGCEWAIKEASKPEFFAIVRADLKCNKVINLEEKINRYELEILKLKKELCIYADNSEEG